MGCVLILAAMVAVACSATETVTINEVTMAEATATARSGVQAAEPTPVNDGAANDTNDPETDPDADSTTDGDAMPDPDSAGGDDGATDDQGAIDGDDGNSAATPTPDSDSSDAAAVGTDSQCRFDFVDDFGDIQIELQFVSPLDERVDATVTYLLTDGNGELLAETSAFFESLAPGEAVRTSVDTLVGEPTDPAASRRITCEVLRVDPAPFGLETFEPGPDDSCEFVEIDTFGDVQILLTVLSPLDSPAELAIDYALRGPDGVRFGDGVNFTTLVDPGEESQTPTDSFTELPDWVPEATLSCEILSIQEF